MLQPKLYTANLSGKGPGMSRVQGFLHPQDTMMLPQAIQDEGITCLFVKSQDNLLTKCLIQLRNKFSSGGNHILSCSIYTTLHIMVIIFGNQRQIWNSQLSLVAKDILQVCKFSVFIFFKCKITAVVNVNKRPMRARHFTGFHRL